MLLYNIKTISTVVLIFYTMHDKDKTHVIVKREIEYKYRLPCNLLKRHDKHFHIFVNNFDLYCELCNIEGRRKLILSCSLLRDLVNNFYDTLGHLCRITLLN